VGAGVVVVAGAADGSACPFEAIARLSPVASAAPTMPPGTRRPLIRLAIVLLRRWT
jgi:hypothetical protein